MVFNWAFPTFCCSNFEVNLGGVGWAFPTFCCSNFHINWGGVG